MEGDNAGIDARTELERSVRDLLLSIADVEEGEQVFGDPDRSTAYFVDGKQMAYLVDENRLALRLSRKKISEMRGALKTDERVDLPRSGGDWIGVRFSGPDDLELVKHLCEAATSVYRPVGRPPRPPPTGPDLARRQRFH